MDGYSISFIDDWEGFSKKPGTPKDLIGNWKRQSEKLVYLKIW